MVNLKKEPWISTAGALLCAVIIGSMSQAAPVRKSASTKKVASARKPALKKPVAGKTTKSTPSNQMILPVKTPPPVYRGTPKQLPAWARINKVNIFGKIPPLRVPRNVTNVAAGKPVTSSDERPIIGSLNLVTDGAKQADEGSWVELAPGKQWVQIDLKKPCNIYAVVVWHYHGEARIYRDVVVQVADDADFITNVRTLFNNDQTNVIGLGLGKDPHYLESNAGKIIPGRNVKARYVRLYSNGSSADEQNHYLEVEVWGK